MAPPRSGQLDEISEAIGRMEGRLAGIDQYNHAREHGINNLAQKVDALGNHITREIAAVEARIDVKFMGLDDRLKEVERRQQEQAGATTLAASVLKSPLIAWLFAIAVGVWAYVTGKVPQ